MEPTDRTNHPTNQQPKHMQGTATEEVKEGNFLTLIYFSILKFYFKQPAVFNDDYERRHRWWLTGRNRENNTLHCGISKAVLYSILRANERTNKQMVESLTVCLPACRGDCLNGWQSVVLFVLPLCSRRSRMVFYNRKQNSFFFFFLLCWILYWCAVYFVPILVCCFFLFLFFLIFVFLFIRRRRRWWWWCFMAVS